MADNTDKVKAPEAAPKPASPASDVPAPDAKDADVASKPDEPAPAGEPVKADAPGETNDESKDGGKPAASAAATPEATLEQSLEEGIGQIAKGFGSLWGVMKARSATTLTQLQTSANKTYQQLQDDVRALQDAKVEVGTKDAAQWEAEQAEAAAKRAEAEAQRAETEAAASPSSSSDPVDVKGKGKARDPAETPGATSPIADAEATARGLLARLSTSTSALQASLQASLNSTLAGAREGLDDPAALRARLAENLRLGDLKLSLQQAERLAESYVAKGRAAGEAWVADAERWVEENVKVVPPEGSVVPSGGWDAGEWYAFSTSAATPRSASPDAGARAGVIAGSRKDAMLARLRADRELLLVDPGAADESAERRDAFAKWVAENRDKMAAEKEKETGNVGGIRMALVPELLDDDTFWTRYLFHRDMIEEQERRRKALLMGEKDLLTRRRADRSDD